MDESSTLPRPPHTVPLQLPTRLLDLWPPWLSGLYSMDAVRRIASRRSSLLRARPSTPLDLDAVPMRYRACKAAFEHGSHRPVRPTASLSGHDMDPLLLLALPESDPAFGTHSDDAPD